MSTVNILEAKTHLSRLVEDIASGAQRDIIIARNGKPAARLVPIETQAVKLGVLKGKYTIPADIDADSACLSREQNALFLEGNVAVNQGPNRTKSGSLQLFFGADRAIYRAVFRDGFELVAQGDTGALGFNFPRATGRKTIRGRRLDVAFLSPLVARLGKAYPETGLVIAGDVITSAASIVDTLGNAGDGQDVMPDFVRDDVGIGEIAATAEALLHLGEAGLEPLIRRGRVA